MGKYLESRGLYFLFQFITAVCLTHVWLVVAGEIFRSAALYWIGGLLVLGLYFYRLAKTLRSPFPEDYAPLSDLILYILAVVVFFASVLRVGGSDDFGGILPDIASISRMLDYDIGDGIFHALREFAFVAPFLGLLSSAMLVWMGFYLRWEIVDAEEPV